MPRNVSLAAMQGALAQQTDEVYLVLLEIDHVDLPSPIRLVNNSEDVVSNSNTYTAYPFEPVLPDDQEAKEPTAEIRVDNVSRDLMDEVRSLTTPPTMTMSVILASSPDSIEWGPLEFLTRGVAYDAMSITFRLAYSSFTEEPFPYRTFNPADFPGMFS